MSATGTTLGGDRRIGRTSAGVGDRLAALARAVEGSRRRRGADVRSVLLMAGAIAIGLGLVAIALGWYGAAHSPFLFQEVPYVISGGLLGVALVAGGGLCVLSSWVVRVLDAERRQGALIEELVRELRQSRAYPVAGAGGGADGAGGDAHSAGNGRDDAPVAGEQP